MKLEVGMCVRTDNGRLGKFVKECGDYYELEYQGCWIDLIFKNRCAKASYNINDLIEARDILLVNGIKYTVLQDEKHFENELYIERITSEGLTRFTTIKHLFSENQVEGIMTHEVFEREAYKVE